MLVHFFACLFLIHAFRDFYYLNDFKLKMLLYKHQWSNVEADAKWISHTVKSGWYHILLWTILVGYMGLLTGFLISLLISLKHHWYWGNSVVVVVIAFVLLRFRVFNWPYVHYIFQFPEIPFKVDNPWCYITNGVAMLSIGLLLFFLRKSIRFIGENNNS
jgi:hypothetical protein